MRQLLCVLLVVLVSACNVEPSKGAAHAARPLPKKHQAVSTSLVISEVYGGGGAGTAAFRYDFVELFNLGAAPVNLNGWSLQYASTMGTSWSVNPLTGTVQPGESFLVRMGMAGSGGAQLPAHDDEGASQMSATAGKVALVNRTTALSGSCPNANSIVDLVGYGMGTNCSEGMPTANTTSMSSARRNGTGCFDTDTNQNDFTVGTPNPRNRAMGPINCGSIPDGGVIVQPPTDGGCIVLSGWPTDESAGLYSPDSQSALAYLYTATHPDGGFDILTFEPYFGDGLTVPATRNFAPGDSYGTCDLCLILERGCNEQTGVCAEALFPQGGSASVTVATQSPDAGRVEGSLSNVYFVPWDFSNDEPTTGGTCVIISSQAVSVSWDESGTGGGGAATAGGSAGGGAAGGGSAGGSASAGGRAGGAAGGSTSAGGGSVVTGGGSATTGGGTATAGGTAGGSLTTPRKPCGCSTGSDALLVQGLAALAVLRLVRRRRAS